MILLAILPLISQVYSVGFTQSTAVEGVLMCEEKPAANVLVKLYDHDTLSPDELMDSAKTDENGHFKLSGTADEVTPIDPKLVIFHDCDDGIIPCQRKLTIYIPSAYVSRTKQPGKPFNFGSLQIAGKFAGETRDCLH